MACVFIDVSAFAVCAPNVYANRNKQKHSAQKLTECAGATHKADLRIAQTVFSSVFLAFSKAVMRS